MKGQAPPPTVLQNVEQWYKDPVTKIKRKVATVAWGQPYALAKSTKRLQELKNNPRGTYFKIVKH